MHHRIRRLAASMLIALLLAMPLTVAADTGTNPPQQVAVGASATFSGTGFNANETLSFWETAPGGGTTALPGTQTDGNGAFSIAVSFPNAGQWQVTAHGLSSLKETVGIFNVGTGTAAAPAPLAPPASGSGTSIAAGAVTGFTGTGFNANETVTVWTTDPNGIVTPQSSAQADAKGVVTVTISFNAIGLWRVTTHGRDSAHEVVGQFQVS